MTPRWRNGRVEQIWPGETVVCMASGPSMTAEDAAYVRGKAKTIVINTTYRLAPWADVLYACDGKWWKWHQGAPEFTGMKFSLDRQAAPFGVTVLRSGPVQGLSRDPEVLCTGRNSGYQAMNLAWLMGASKIVLLGYDMQRGTAGKEHWHEDHPVKATSDYRGWSVYFESIARHLANAGVEVVNCSRASALKCFPRQPLEQVL